MHRGQDSNPQPEEEEEEEEEEEGGGDASGERSNMALVPYTENALPALAKLHNSTATFHLAGREVRLKQDWRGSGVAAVVWDAAVVLALYLELTPVELGGRSVIELGAGTGLVGIVAALLGARVTITDRRPALDLLAANVRANVPPDLRPGSAAVSELSWGAALERYPPGAFSLVLGADIVYLEDTFPALLATLEHLCGGGGGGGDSGGGGGGVSGGGDSGGGGGGATVVLLACKIRYERDSRFLELLGRSFVVEEVHFDRQRDIRVYRAVRRPPPPPPPRGEL